MSHNRNLSQDTSTIEISRMTSWSQLIFDNSDSVCSRTKEYKNHSHKNSKLILINGCWNLAYMSLTLMDPLYGLKWDPLKIDSKP